MKKLFVAALFSSISLMAAERQWKPAIVTGIEPRHGTHTTQYSVSAEGVTYVLSTNVLGGCQPLLTLNGATKLAVDGTHAIVINDNGKECKLRISYKVADNCTTQVKLEDFKALDDYVNAVAECKSKTDRAEASK